MLKTSIPIASPTVFAMALDEYLKSNNVDILLDCLMTFPVMENGRSLAGYLSLTQIHDPTTGTASVYGPITVVSTMAWGLGYFGMPHILLRFMAIENDEKLSLSRRVASIWVVISMAIAILIGIVGLGMTRSVPCRRSKALLRKRSLWRSHL